MQTTKRRMKKKAAPAGRGGAGNGSKSSSKGPAASRNGTSARKQERGATKSERSPNGKPPDVEETLTQDWFEIRRSRIQGHGAFALRRIPKGTRVIEYIGERISNKEADRRYDDARMKRHHTFLFTLDDETVVDGGVGGNESRYINHSCDPNCETVIVRRRIWVETMKSIPAGTELVYDYAYERGEETSDADEKLYVCRCGSTKCRGTILVEPEPPRKRGKKK